MSPSVEDPLGRSYDRNSGKSSNSASPLHASYIPVSCSVRPKEPLKKFPTSPSLNCPQQPLSTAHKYGDTDGPGYSNDPSPDHQSSSNLHERQFSSTSLEHSLQELDRNLQDMLMESSDKDSKSHVVEWLKQTSEDALPPDVAVEQELQLASPISTEHSFNYSPVSVVSVWCAWLH